MGQDASLLLAVPIHVNIKRVLSREIFPAHSARIDKARIEVDRLDMITRVTTHTEHTLAKRALKAAGAAVIPSSVDEAVQVARFAQREPLHCAPIL
jgi:hypothetical protein